jgi:DNA-binding transcriptional regulator YiaG
MKPDISKHRPNDAAYVRKLLDKAGVSQREAARILGVTDRAMRFWCAGETIPYTVQFALECLAAPD